MNRTTRKWVYIVVAGILGAAAAAGWITDDAVPVILGTLAGMLAPAVALRNLTPDDRPHRGG